MRQQKSNATEQVLLTKVCIPLIDLKLFYMQIILFIPWFPYEVQDTLCIASAACWNKIGLACIVSASSEGPQPLTEQTAWEYIRRQRFK